MTEHDDERALILRIIEGDRSAFKANTAFKFGSLRIMRKPELLQIQPPFLLTAPRVLVTTTVSITRLLQTGILPSINHRVLPK